VKHLLLVLSCFSWFGDGFCAVAAGEGEGVAAEAGGAVGAVGAGWSAVVALGLTYDGLSLCLVPLLDVLQCGCGLRRRCHDGALLPGRELPGELCRFGINSLHVMFLLPGHHWRSWGWFVSWSLSSFLLFPDGHPGFEKFEDKSWVFKSPKTRLKCTVQGFFFLRRDDC
jgi:hypothetical protein